jgi:multisubunit Na+/H+ antiporter MnhB subunit
MTAGNHRPLTADKGRGSMAIRKKMFKILRHGTIILISLTVVLVLIYGLGTDQHWPVRLRDSIVESGLHDTGATNLVAAVYLGYRALDTLGETIVLLLAVSGLLFIIREKEH